MDESLTNLQGKNRTSQFRLARPIIVFVLVASVLGYGAYRIYDWLNPFAGRFFNQKVWLAYANDDDPDNPRASMVADLRWRHLRRGMTRSEIEELLGTPDWEQRDDLYSYNIGMWSGFRIDYDSLDIHFDSDGKLTHVRRVQH